MAIYFNLSEDKKNLVLDRTNSNYNDCDEFDMQFRRKDDNYYHDPRYKAGMWNGYISFLKNDTVATGLWLEAQNTAYLMNSDIYFNGLIDFLDLDLDIDELKNFLDGVISEIKNIDDLRYYQHDAIVKLLQYKFANSEVATSGGKTLISYLLFLYLKYVKKVIDKDNKFLIIVPRISLVKQTYKKFVETYKTSYDFNIFEIDSKKKFIQEDFDNADIVISTYQSLNRKKKPFFSVFKAILIDEAHTSINKTITNVINKSVNVEYKFGLSGTLKINERYANYLKLQEVIGPIVHRVPAKELIDNKFSSDVYVSIIKLLYNPEGLEYYKKLVKLHKNATEALKENEIISIKPFNSIDELIDTIFNLEKEMIVSYENRIKFIALLTKSLNKNTLILFNDIKGGYGKKIYKALLENDITSYYIDGDTKVKLREEYADSFEKSSGEAIVASYGTYSTGIDISNIYYIILAESYKSEKLIRQTIGRGMRLEDTGEKNKVIVIDLVDSFGKYSKKQSYVRKGIYKEQKFHIDTFTKKI